MNSVHFGERQNSSGDTVGVRRSAVSATNDEVTIHTNGNSNTDHQSPQSSYRVSPYDSIVSENIMGDDRTIDAAVVEEIVEDNNLLIAASHEHNSPASSSHRLININDSGRNNNATPNVSAEAQLIPVAVSNQNHIPEVEPEVDIEEVHVQHDRNNMSTISALTTNTTSIDQQDTKQPPSASAPRVATAVVNDDTQRHHQPTGGLPYPPIHPTFSTPAAAAFAALPPAYTQWHSVRTT